MSLSSVGQHRENYAIAACVEDPRPSRFANGGEDYRAWCERADRASIYACCTSTIGAARCLHYNRVPHQPIFAYVVEPFGDGEKYDLASSHELDSEEEMGQVLHAIRCGYLDGRSRFGATWTAARLPRVEG